MQNEHRLRALHLLAQDARLTAKATRLLNALVMANPVAPRGAPTMVPCDELIVALNEEVSGSERKIGTRDEIQEVLDEVVDAHWSMLSRRGFMVGEFLNGYTMSGASGFLHFQLDGGFVTALKDIGRQFEADSGRPSKGSR